MNTSNTRFIGQEPGALPLACALAKAGQSVILIEEDVYDYARLHDELPRLLGGAARYLTLVQDWGLPGIRFSAGPDAQISTDWATSGGRPALHLSTSTAYGTLVEQIGADPSGQIARIAEALGGWHLCLPSGTIPLAARFHAVLGRALEECLLSDGTPEELDQALIAAGFSMGPFARQDQLGIDTLLRDRLAVEARLGLPPRPLFARAVAEGRLGRKASVGWYRYPGQGSGPVEDPLVEDMAEEEARFAGWPRCAQDPNDAARWIAQKIEALAQELETAGVVTAAELWQVARIAIGYSRASSASRPAMRPSTTAASNPLPDK